MLNDKDKLQLKRCGISSELFKSQINNFKNGFPFIKIVDAATPANKGVKVLTSLQIQAANKEVESYKGSISKFVPASGAASRMFKGLFEGEEEITKNGVLYKDSQADIFIKHIAEFPFFDSRNILKMTLYGAGLNYGSKPKGLILFHKYPDGNRTAFEEHLVEGALYAKDKKGVVNIVVTVSPEHLKDFKKLLSEVKERYENRYNCKYNILFTTQSASTNIVAVDMKNNPFRTEEGNLLFRPGGHGALLHNLNKIKSDIIIIKNIDNVVKENHIVDTIKWKRILIGRAIYLQKKSFEYLRELDKTSSVQNKVDLLIEICDFLQNEFSITIPSEALITAKNCGSCGVNLTEIANTLKEKLNRPLRVCGMVKNEGEPGGGPFITEDQDKCTSLQILESAQIDLSDPLTATAVNHSTHFNPVDLVCAIKNYKGVKFNLLKYTNPLSGFISAKSYHGKKIKAQELPGLWNGAMSNWNTQFVEVPISTFNPVKTVIDLLRPMHKG